MVRLSFSEHMKPLLIVVVLGKIVLYFLSLAVFQSMVSLWMLPPAELTIRFFSFSTEVREEKKILLCLY